MLLLVVILSHCKETTKKRVLQRIFPTSRGNFPIHHFVLTTVSSRRCGNGGTVFMMMRHGLGNYRKESGASGLPVQVLRTPSLNT